MPQGHDVMVGGGTGARCVRHVGEASEPVVVYFPGTPESRLSIDGFAVEGVQWVAMDRPGYGGSAPSPFSFATIADDTVRVLDHLGIERASLLGHSGGGPFALAMGAHHPERVARIGVSQGPGVYSQVPEAWETLVGSDLEAVRVASTDPDRAVQLFASGFHDLRASIEQPNDLLLAYLLQALPADTHVLSDETLQLTFFASLREGVRTGVQGCAYDNLAWCPDWAFNLADVTAPVELFYGARDTLMPPTHGRWLRQQLPDARLHLWESAGHLDLLARSAEVAAMLTRPV